MREREREREREGFSSSDCDFLGAAGCVDRWRRCGLGGRGLTACFFSPRSGQFRSDDEMRSGLMGDACSWRENVRLSDNVGKRVVADHAGEIE